MHALRYVAVHFHATPVFGRSAGPDTLPPTPASERDRLLQLQLNNDRSIPNQESTPARSNFSIDMDALFSERITPWTSSWLGHGCSVLRTALTMASSETGLDP